MSEFERQLSKMRTPPNWIPEDPPVNERPGMVSVHQLQNPLSAEQARQLEEAKQDLREGRSKDGIRILKDALTDRAAKPYAYAILGTEYLRQQRVQLAIQNLTQAAQLLPGSKAVHANLGYALCLAGQQREGEQELRKAVALDPKLPASCQAPELAPRASQN
jgi:Flp pilus assembly protein TadD